MDDFEILNKSIEDLKKRVADKKVDSIVVEETINMMYTTSKRRHRIAETFFSFNPVGRGIAAGIAILFVFGAVFVSRHVDFSSTVWAEVQSNIDKVNYSRFVELEFANNLCVSSRHGWYYKGKVFTIEHRGQMTKDDGNTKLTYTKDGLAVSTEKSEFSCITTKDIYSNFFNLITLGILKYTEKNISESIPVEYGDDFMTYTFGIPENSDGIERVDITVGRRSKLPIVLKVYEKSLKDRYTMYIFEYGPEDVPEDIAKIADK
ncbi:MAG: hypothetical protein NTW55_02000 [Planctomycetota bacterium]|nr:hypothetical protein [Planctomycetota bacterium]